MNNLLFELSDMYNINIVRMRNNINLLLGQIINHRIVGIAYKK